MRLVLCRESVFILFVWICPNEKMAPRYCLDSLGLAEIYTGFSNMDTFKTLSNSTFIFVNRSVHFQIFFPVQCPLTKLRQKQVVRSPPWAASVLFCTRGFQKSFPGFDKYDIYFLTNLHLEQKCLLSCHICGELHLPPASIIPNCFQSE